jgi:DNA-binding NarL/FixJ family response regulator
MTNSLSPERMSKLARCLSEGMTDKEIATELGITYATAKHYVQIFRVKIGKVWESRGKLMLYLRSSG